MRKLFIPLAKLLGIYMPYLPLTYLATIVYYLFSSFFSEQSTIRTTFLYTSFVNILSLLLALVLLLKTEKVADILRLPDDDINLTSIDRCSILHTGLILIGIVIVIYGITAFLGYIIAYFSYRDIVSTPVYYQQHERMISSIFRAILGVILIFKTRAIARFFDRHE